MRNKLKVFLIKIVTITQKRSLFYFLQVNLSETEWVNYTNSGANLNITQTIRIKSINSVITGGIISRRVLAKKAFFIS